MIKTFSIQVSFGDCDPAGIVFYPNIFRWMDATFHGSLRAYGGHGAVCRTLDSAGLGLVDASVQFHRPMRDGDLLRIDIERLGWTRRTLTLNYAGYVGDGCAFTGREVRCLFMRTKTGMVAGDLDPLRKILEATHD